MSKIALAQKDVEIARLYSELEGRRTELAVLRAEKEVLRVEKDSEIESLRADLESLRKRRATKAAALVAAAAAAPNPSSEDSDSESETNDDPSSIEESTLYHLSTRNKKVGIKKGHSGHISAAASEAAAVWGMKTIKSGLQKGAVEFWCQEAITVNMVLDRWKGGDGTDEVCVYKHTPDIHKRKGGNTNQRWYQTLVPGGFFLSPASDRTLFLKIAEDGRLVCSPLSGDVFSTTIVD
jgi:hypothetical protein